MGWERNLKNVAVNNMNHPQTIYMEKAIKEAKRALRQGQYPEGAVVVRNDKILSIAHTTLHRDNDPTAHAEINAIRKAARKVKSRYLQKAWLYTTQEPCPMCAAAAIWAKMEGIVFGATMSDALKVFKKQKDKKFTWRQINITAREVVKRGEPKLKLIRGFLRKECLKLYGLGAK